MQPSERTWMIDELAHAGQEHLDAAYVDQFDAKQGYPSAERDIEALEARGVGRQAVVIDFGAGTGQFALPAAAHFGRVIAVDVSPAMVAHLRLRAETEGLANVSVVQAGFFSYGHQGPPVDGVHARHVLHQLPDFWKAMALARIAGLMRQGGILELRDLIYDFEPGTAEGVFKEWFRGAANDPALGYTADDYAEHIRTEHSTFRWLFEPMLEHAGFQILRAEFSSPTYGAYTCVKLGGGG